LLIPECTYRRGRRGTVGCQQGERGFLGDAVVLRGVVAVHLVDCVPSDTGNRLAPSEQIRERDLKRVHGGNVMHHHAKLSSVFGKARLPFRLGKCGCKRRQCGCAGLETDGKGF
jgi:hypothetical protein